VPTISVKDLLEAGVHFGHQTKRWNPKMKRYIFGARNGIYIIDLSKTLHELLEAQAFVFEAVSRGGSVLFVGTKQQAQEAIKDAAVRCDQFYVTHRWLGGTLTNNRTIHQSIQRMSDLDRMLEEGELKRLGKKQEARIRREVFKLHRNLDGIARMSPLPAAVFVVDIKREAIAVSEARRLKIPVVAIVDTNCDPDLPDYPVPGNDDAIRAIRLIASFVADTVNEAREHYAKTMPQVSEAEMVQEAKPDAIIKSEESAAPIAEPSSVGAEHSGTEPDGRQASADGEE